MPRRIKKKNPRGREKSEKPSFFKMYLSNAEIIRTNKTVYISSFWKYLHFICIDFPYLKRNRVITVLIIKSF